MKKGSREGASVFVGISKRRPRLGFPRGEKASRPVKYRRKTDNRGYTGSKGGSLPSADGAARILRINKGAPPKQERRTKQKSGRLPGILDRPTPGRIENTIRKQ
jgi:hypothetical protein